MGARKAPATQTVPAWSAVSCPTNDRVWNPRWADTRHLTQTARRDSLFAVNGYGALRLFDVADARDVKPLAELKLPSTGTGLPEDCPIGFIDPAHVAMSTPKGMFIVNVANPSTPHLVETVEPEPFLRDGTFVDGVFYGSGIDASGLYAMKPSMKTPIRFAKHRNEFGGAGTFVRAGGLLFALGSSDLEVYRVDEHGMPEADAAPQLRKKIDTASDARHMRINDFAVVVSGCSGFGIQIVDFQKPENPKLQKRLVKEEPRGAGLSDDGKRLLVAHGPYQQHLDLTTLALDRPQSTVTSTVRLTNDPELASALAYIEGRGRELFVMGASGRFALLEPA